MHKFFSFSGQSHIKETGIHFKTLPTKGFSCAKYRVHMLPCDYCSKYIAFKQSKVGYSPSVAIVKLRFIGPMY
jgi:hypothetical protein